MIIESLYNISLDQLVCPYLYYLLVQLSAADPIAGISSVINRIEDKNEEKYLLKLTLLL